MELYAITTPNRTPQGLETIQEYLTELLQALLEDHAGLFDTCFEQ